MHFNKDGSVSERIADQSAVLNAAGGHSQQDRMIQGKLKSFEKALQYSYQSANIAAVGMPEVLHKALINPNVTKPDYDDKILSTDYRNGYKPGDVLIWYGKQGTKVVPSYWLIYLQDLTELAYFKGDIRKCNYYIRWKNEMGLTCGAWVAIRGPVETKIDSIAKNNISLDSPNHTLNILMPKTTEVLKYFKRYNKFYLSNVDEVTDQICWRITATDTISMPGVLELTAEEYYANESEDDNGIIGEKLAMTSIEPDMSLIEGPNVIKPKCSYTFTYTGSEKDKWHLPADLPVDVKASENTIVLKWTAPYSGEEFILTFGSSTKRIVVESLF